MKKQQTPPTEYSRIAAPCDKGLTALEVENRLAHGLGNEVKNTISKSYLKIIVSNVFTVFNLLCLLCFIAMTFVEKSKPSDFIFVLVYLLNTSIGIIQEIRAKHAIEKLSLVKKPTSIVIREGKKLEVVNSQIVLDDILELTLGCQIPADCILLEGSVEANESLLTGESVPVKKKVGDVLLSGSFIASGTCLCRAEKVGKESYLQSLSIKAKKYKKPESRLFAAMNSIIYTVGILILPIAAVMGLVNYKVIGNDTSLVIARTVSVVIGMIPSGMFLLTSMALAVGVIKMSRMNTLVQDMYALEMLARVNVLCLDKTGTITDGQMTVTNIISFDDSEDYKTIIASMQKALGDSNQTAEALKAYFKTEKLLTPIKALPFSSSRKLTAVSFENSTYLLGAPAFVLNEIPAEVKKEMEKYSNAGKRVLLLAKTPDPIVDEPPRENILPVCLIVLEDNIRSEAIDTIKWFKDNDVKVKVISGDDPVTVARIAERAGVENADAYIDLSTLNDIEVANIADKYTVFGRVSPEQKAVLVKALKTHGNTVAMTGDGVNDILAMKEADCSVTVASGSDAARSISHLVLLDNNFNSMPQVVREGRRVINNIQQSASLYLMKTVFTFVFAIISILTTSKYPFDTGMMIVFEFFIIGCASFCLSLQPNDKRVEGNFIGQVFKNALPGTVILVFNVLILPALIRLCGLTPSEGLSNTLLVLALTFGGWIFLSVLCFPYNKFRASLVATIFIVLLMWSVFFLDSNFFKMTPLVASENWREILLLFGVLVIDIPLLILSRFLFNKLKNLNF